MSIVAISHDASHDGRKIARAVADRLGYRCVGPEIIERACQSLNVPLSCVDKALHHPPSFFDGIVARRERVLAMFRAAFYDAMCCGEVVYDGLAGHIMLADVPGAITVRINTDSKRRGQSETRRDRLSEEEASTSLKGRVKNSVKWAKRVTGEDPYDSRFYDLVLDLGKFPEDVVTSIIVNAVRASVRRQNEQLTAPLKDLALGAKIEACLLDAFPEVQVIAHRGAVEVILHGALIQERAMVEKATEMLADIDGIQDIRVGVAPSIYVPF